MESKYLKCYHSHRIIDYSLIATDFRMAYRMIHRGPYMQRGMGIGSLFRSLFRAVIPMAKSGAKTLMTQGVRAVKSRTGRKLLKTAKRELTKGNIKAITGLISGQDNVAQDAKEDLTRARKRLGQTLQATKPRKRRRKKSNKFVRPKITSSTSSEEW